MVTLFANLSAADADTYSLVLSSMGLAHHLIKGENGWDLLVGHKDYETAESLIREYLQENENFQAVDQPVSQTYQKTLSGLWAALMLLICHGYLTLFDNREALIAIYGSSALHIVQGELYRIATALMIHADALHLAGNMTGIAIFGTAVCAITGWGFGWFMILVAGIIGNLLNAVFYGSDHLSVGASTAIFGAIGILTAYQFFKKIGFPGQRLRAFVPLGGGLALLGMLGTAEHSDLMAHLFGFISGIIIGSIYAVCVRQPPSKGYQMSYFIIALSILVLSWMRAFVYG